MQLDATASDKGVFARDDGDRASVRDERTRFARGTPVDPDHTGQEKGLGLLPAGRVAAGHEQPVKPFALARSTRWFAAHDVSSHASR